MRRLLAVLLVACVALLACGSDGDDGATRGATAPPTTSSAFEQAAADRQRLLDDARAAYGAPGGLALVVDGDERWVGVSGATDLQGTPVTPDVRFRIASITKPITAAIVLSLVADGRLGLDDDVATLVPGLLRPEQPVTVRQLLDHTSGIYDEGNEGDPRPDIAGLADPLLRAEAEDLVARYAAGEPVVASPELLVALAETHDRYGEPGRRHHYSNPNYHLAGLVAEAAGGTDLATLLHDRIVSPLGLVATSLAPADRTSPELRGFTTPAAGGSLVDVTDDLLAFGDGASGGIVSTAGDLLAMLTAIVDSTLLPDDLVTEMLRPSPQSQGSYGLGLATYHLRCGTAYGHGGGVNGTASLALVDVERGRGAVVVLNLRSAQDPDLLALADALLCGDA